jgi:hypothetical protein
MDGADDLGVVNLAQIHRGDPEMRMPELALDDQQRHALARHLDGMSMPQLMVAPTSAQASLGRPGCYVDAG